MDLSFRHQLGGMGEAIIKENRIHSLNPHAYDSITT